MRYLALSSTILLFSAASAFAQNAGYSQTLDSQYQRVQQGMPGVPAGPTSVTTTTTTHTQPMEGMDSMGSGAIPSLPLQEISASGITYLTGGIGDEEEAQLKSQMHQYNTRILMTAASGEYVSEAALTITGKGGNVVKIDNVGPYFYTNLPAGAYNVEAASKQGDVKRMHLNVGSKAAVQQHIVFKE